MGFIILRRSIGNFLPYPNILRLSPGAYLSPDVMLVFGSYIAWDGVPNAPPSPAILSSNSILLKMLLYKLDFTTLLFILICGTSREIYRRVKAGASY